jgi:SpoIID/LytB domain protein
VKGYLKLKLIKVIGLAILSLILTVQIAISQTEKSLEPEITVGIIQRLGENPDTKLTISGTENNLLTVKLPGTSNEVKTISAPQIILEVKNKPITNPILSEILVLSDQGTFETAEDSAKKWEKLGIKVEITQPNRWQVWAKRDVYQTPLLRRLLLQSLQNQGYTDPYLETKLLTEITQISLNINEETYQVENLEISSPNNLLRVTENEQLTTLYGGSLILQPNSYHNFTLVNKVPLETYLRGVVPHEIGPNAPTEAVKAQTIIARTYALRNLRRFQADNYQLCANTHCQVYKGLNGTTPGSDNAITATKGQVLTYENQLVDALYYSTSGGVTSFFNDIWNGENRPYLKSVIDSPTNVWDLQTNPLTEEENLKNFINLKQGFNETGRSVFRWNRPSNIEDLSADLRHYLERIKHPFANFNLIQNMKVTERSPSGRILTMQVETDLGLVELHKNEVRSAFTPPISTLFYLEPILDQNQKLTGYTFIGGGFGHGVGLSQFGSYNLANLGWNSEKILKFYYPGTTIKPLDNSIIFAQESQ